MKEKGLRSVIAEIKKHKYFLLTTHTNPEGDALGSELAFFSLLRKLGKKVTVVNQDPLPNEYSFLPFVEHIKRYGSLGKYIFDCMVF